MSQLQIVQTPNSKAIEKIMFDKKRSIMYIQFTNSPNYSYNADEAIFNAFAQAESHGKFYHQYIKNNFQPLERLDN